MTIFFFFSRVVPKALPSGSACRQSVQKLSPRGENFAFLQLLSHVESEAAAHISPSNVVCEFVFCNSPSSSTICCSLVLFSILEASFFRNAWDLALDLCLSQLRGIQEGKTFQHGPFFAEQLTAFQVWLSYGNEKRSPPEQLPIVLQVRRVWFTC